MNFLPRGLDTSDEEIDLSVSEILDFRTLSIYVIAVVMTRVLHLGIKDRKFSTKGKRVYAMKIGIMMILKQ